MVKRGRYEIVFWEVGEMKRGWIVEYIGEVESG